MFARICFFMCCLALLSAGCASQQILMGHANDQAVDTNLSATTTQRYLGWLTVKQPINQLSNLHADTQALRVSGFGLRWGHSVSLGYFDEIRLALPLGCRIVVLIKNGKEAQAARDLLIHTLKESPCTVYSPS
jgi:hypothetical protein